MKQYNTIKKIVISMLAINLTKSIDSMFKSILVTAIRMEQKKIFFFEIKKKVKKLSLGSRN